MKYIINALLFLIMIYSLTVMPIDMKALQVDVSWEKYKAIEEKKETEKQQTEIEETVKESPYQLTYEGESYLFNPSQLALTLSGDEKLSDLQSDVIGKLTFEWTSTSSGDVQVLSVPQEAIKVGSLSGTNITTLPLTISLASLTQLTDGQYTLKINSTSELTKSSVSPELAVTWIKKSSYTPYTGTGFGKSLPVTVYYPTADASQFIPITESFSNSKTLRKIANFLYAGQTENTALKTGQLIPRVRTIKFGSSVLSLYFTSADIETAKANGLSPVQMTGLLTKTYFSLDYLKEIKLYIDNKPADLKLLSNPTPEPIVKVASSPEIYQLTAVGNTLLFAPTAHTYSSVQELLTGLTTVDPALKNKQILSPIPANVSLNAVADPANTNRITIDLKITGILYGSDPTLTQMMLDAIALNVTKAGFAKEVLFTVNGQPAEVLNAIPIKEPYKTPTYINVKTAKSD